MIEGDLSPTDAQDLQRLSLYSGEPSREDDTSCKKSSGDLESQATSETMEARQRRWDDRNRIFSAHPLLSWTAPGAENGEKPEIRIKSEAVDSWIEHAKVRLGGREKGNDDDLALQLKELVETLCSPSPHPYQEATHMPGADSTIGQELKQLGEEAALALWIFACAPVQEYDGVEEEVSRLRREAETLIKLAGE